MNEFICCKELEKLGKEINANKVFKDEIKAIYDKDFTFIELNNFLEKKENITPAIDKILELEKKGYLTRKDTYKIFFSNTTLDDSLNASFELTEEKMKELIDSAIIAYNIEDIKKVFQGLISPKCKSSKNWKNFFLRHGYINEKEEIIYKPQPNKDI